MPKGHAVVDGSNLATEGRSVPSLVQLDEAVATFIADHDFAHVTVVVDASFEHRVDNKEQRAVKRAMALSGDRVAQAADMLGVSRPTLYDLMEKYRLK